MGSERTPPEVREGIRTGVLGALKLAFFSAVWAGLLVVSLSIALLQLRTPSLPRHEREPAVAQGLDLRGLELPQLRERILGAVLLPDAQGRVQDQDGGDRDRLDRDARRAVRDPDAEVDGERCQEDVDERAPQLANDAASEREPRRLGERVRTVAREAPPRLLALEAARSARRGDGARCGQP